MLKLSNVKKSFGDNEVLKGISLSAEKGEIISIIGPSGSGKSTLLRTINFLESADEGHIEIDGLSLDMKKATEAQKRMVRQKAAMVFQSYNLFRNKTALENIMEGLLFTGEHDKRSAEALALEYLEKVGLSQFRDSMPSQMSGGQQQRVGIARALALKPKIILFDEPTSALDPELVGEVLEVIRSLAAEDVSMIIVTHEMAFAKEISDRVIFMDKGLVAADGAPQSVFGSTDSLRLQEFLRRVSA